MELLVVVFWKHILYLIFHPSSFLSLNPFLLAISSDQENQIGGGGGGGFPGGPVVRTLCFHCWRSRFNPWLGDYVPVSLVAQRKERQCEWGGCGAIQFVPGACSGRHHPQEMTILLLQSFGNQSPGLGFLVSFDILLTLYLSHLQRMGSGGNFNEIWASIFYSFPTNMIAWLRVLALKEGLAIFQVPISKEPTCHCRRHKRQRLESLSQEDPLEKEMATHYSILAWRIPWTEGPGRPQSMGSQRVTCNLVIKPPGFQYPTPRISLLFWNWTLIALYCKISRGLLSDICGIHAWRGLLWGLSGHFWPIDLTYPIIPVMYKTGITWELDLVV